jgi:flagellar hook protein FlgE
MSLSSAMNAGVSALKTFSSALAGVSNNIANVDTTAYKRMETNFETNVTPSSARSYSAGGVTSNTTQYISQPGAIKSTDSIMDIAIDGEGFMVGTEKAVAGDQDKRVFTRSGALAIDKEGYIVNAEGFYIQAWLIDRDGNINADPSDLEKLGSINITNLTSAVEPTNKGSITANIDSEQPLSLAITNATYAANSSTASMSVYDPKTSTGTRPDYEITLAVTDSKGGKRDVTLSMIRSATPNTWNAEIWSKDINDGNGRGQIRTGNLVFSPDGTLDTNVANSTLLTSAGGSLLTIGASAAGAGVRWKASLGVAAQTVDIDLNKVTQYASGFLTRNVITNGTNFGNVQTIEIAADGVVTAVYDTEVTRTIAKIAIATFTNPDGLKAISGNAFVTASAAGVFSLNPPGSGDSGELVTSALEASTVDLSTELTRLIEVQRAYSAASKIITTTDTMMETLLGIKR